MNMGEVADIFIMAAEIDRRLPAEGRGGGSGWVPYTHDTADKNGWGTKRLQEEREEFWQRVRAQVSTSEMGVWEEAMRLTREVLIDPGQRRALWAWAMAKAGGRSFARWCFDIEGIHPETGARRKNRALSMISFALARKPLEDNESAGFGVLPPSPDFADIQLILNAAAGDTKGAHHWRADDAELAVLGADQQDFSWAAKRNEMRRQREKRRRKGEDKRAA